MQKLLVKPFVEAASLLSSDPVSNVLDKDYSNDIRAIFKNISLKPLRKIGPLLNSLDLI